MGLLKHVIFPLLGLLHLNTVIQTLVLDNRLELSEMWGQTQDVTSLTKVENHLAGTIGSVSAALLFGCIMAVLREDSHFRGILLIMHLIFYIIDCYDSYKLDTPGFNILLVINIVLIISLIVHVNEPGIFTKSKDNSSGKKEIKRV